MCVGCRSQSVELNYIIGNGEKINGDTVGNDRQNWVMWWRGTEKSVREKWESHYTEGWGQRDGDRWWEKAVMCSHWKMWQEGERSFQLFTRIYVQKKDQMLCITVSYISHLKLCFHKDWRSWTLSSVVNQLFNLMNNLNSLPQVHIPTIQIFYRQVVRGVELENWKQNNALKPACYKLMNMCEHVFAWITALE